MFELPKSFQDLGYIVGGALLSVLLFLAGTAFSPFLAVFSSFVQLPLLCLGLGCSISFQFYASLLAFVSIALLRNGLFALLFVNLASAMLLSWLALRRRQGSKGTLFWYPPGRLIAEITMCSLCTLRYFSNFFSREDVKSVFLGVLVPTTPDHLHTQDTYLVDQIIKFMPCIMTVSVILLTLFNAMIAQSVLVRYQKNLRPTPAVSDIELPWSLWLSLAVCGVVALVLEDAQRQFFINAALVLLFAFLFEGLGIIHRLLERYSPGKMFIWIFYIIMIFFSWPVLIVIVLGLFDPWIKLHERLGLS